MTICVSAIGTIKEKGKERDVIVFSTDHMISTHLGQFEKEIKKYKVLNKNIVAMLAGQTLLFDRALDGTEGLHEFKAIRDKIQENLQKIRKEIIKKEIYDRFGIDEEYVKTLLANPIHNPFIENILKTTAEFNLQTSILLIGLDEKGCAQISEVDEIGHASYRDIHFHAIGSGSTQALNTLLFQKHSKNSELKTTIYTVYKAKRNAEVASGVGKETEVMILEADKIYSLGEKELETLSKIYEEELQHGVQHTSLNTLFPLDNKEK